MSIIEKTKKIVATYEAKKAIMIDEMKTTLFDEVYKELFTQDKELISFSWSQYTPYFNDGEECEFCVREIDEINGEYIDDYENDVIKDSLKEIHDLIPKEFMLSVFGNHVQVTINSDGTVDVEEYDHD